MKQNSKNKLMNKDALISSVSEISGLSKKDSTKALESMLQSIQIGLKNSREVRITGFGTFGITERKAREGRNPRTGKAIKIAASKHPKFKAGKILKEAIT
jgi:DNA-binding protein HU-beta